MEIYDPYARLVTMQLIIIGLYVLSILTPLLLIKFNFLKPTKKIILLLGIGHFAIVLGFFLGNRLPFIFESNEIEDSNSNSISYELGNQNVSGTFVISDFSKSFSGAINNKYNIEMTLNNQSGLLSGGYKYSGKDVFLKLTGKIDNDGNFSMDEFDADGLFTGHFDGKLTGTAASGTWSKPSGGNSMPFTMSEVESNNQGNEEALADSYYLGFLSTPTGERYKKIKIQVLSNDEAGTTSEIEVISPVEGLYVNNKEGKTRSIKISYDGEKIYVSHWVDSEQLIKEDAYFTSKGYFAFGSEEFDYDRYGETVDEVQNLTLVERYSGEIFSWSNEVKVH